MLQRIDDFLSHFGLALGFDTPIPCRSEDLALISVPSHSAVHDSTSVTVGPESEEKEAPDQNVIVDFSVNLPANIDQRFTRLVRLFNLKVVDSPIDAISFSAKDATTDNKEKKKSMLTGVKNIVSNEIKPRWLLWSTFKGETGDD